MNDIEELKSKIEELEARIEIERLIMNYGKAVDSPDLDEGHSLFVSIFSNDCVFTNPTLGITLKGNGDNAPIFDENDPKKVITPGCIGWMYKNFIFPNQEEYVSLIGNVVIDIDGNTATGSDQMIRSGYRKPKPENPAPDDLEFTHAVHKFKFKRIDNTWKITYLEGNPVHSTAGVKKDRN